MKNNNTCKHCGCKLDYSTLKGFGTCECGKAISKQMLIDNLDFLISISHSHLDKQSTFTLSTFKQKTIDNWVKPTEYNK